MQRREVSFDFDWCFILTQSLFIKGRGAVVWGLRISRRKRSNNYSTVQVSIDTTAFIFNHKHYFLHIFLFSIRALPYCRISSPWHRAERLHNVENLKRYVQYVARNTALWASYHSTNSYFKLSVVRVRQGSLHIPPCFCVMYKLYFQVLLLAKSCIAHTCMSTWAN